MLSGVRRSCGIYNVPASAPLVPYLLSFTCTYSVRFEYKIGSIRLCSGQACLALLSLIPNALNFLVIPCLTYVYVHLLLPEIGFVFSNRTLSNMVAASKPKALGMDWAGSTSPANWLCFFKLHFFKSASRPVIGFLCLLFRI